jgi:pilus assembly protein TadC
MISGYVKKLNPELGKKLRLAGIRVDQEAYIAKLSSRAILFAILVTLIASIFVIEGTLKRGWTPLSYLVLPIVFFLLLFFFTNLLMMAPNSAIKKRKIELESDLLYSARFLLLKMESGSPLLNALIDVSNLHTKSSKFFKEIVTDIYLGTPLEDAIEQAKEHSPSKSYSKVLEEVQNSLRTGADLERSLKSTLDEITKAHVLAIKEYGKKLSPLSMFYMILGTIVPSLGSALLLIGLGTMSPGASIWTIFVFLLLVLAIVQVFFIMFFKALKPSVMN